MNESALDQQSEHVNDTMGRSWEKAVLIADRRQDAKEGVCESRNCRNISAFAFTAPPSDQDADLKGKPGKELAVLITSVILRVLWTLNTACH